MNVKNISIILFLLLLGSILYIAMFYSGNNNKILIKDDVKSELKKELVKPIESTAQANLNNAVVENSEIGQQQIDEELTLGDKFDRLIEVDNTIDDKNNEYLVLINEYDEDLSNKEVRENLSKALLNDEQYRSEILEKFKIEKELNEKLN